jgi:predicted type IV restriction endonuclease
MTLKEHIDDIRKGLEAGQYGNEASVSQGIVLRLLNILAWPTFDTQVVIPEYGVEGTRVDFALCHPPSKPLVFIEVKQVGKIEGAEKQLFQYAFHTGVPIAILTDGREWHFFHPSGQGDYRERRVYKLDLIERNSEESATRLNRYLHYQSIRTGEAVEAIKADYEKVVQQRQVATRLPEAWSKLVEEADEFLLHAVAEKTESLCGYRPTDEQVLNFLKSLKRKIDPDNGKRRSSRNPGLFVTMPDGGEINHKVSAITFAEVVEKLGVERVRNLNKVYIIPIISTSKHHTYNQHKSGRYYIMTHSDTKTKKRLLEEIASELGESLLKVEIVEKS